MNFDSFQSKTVCQTTYIPTNLLSELLRGILSLDTSYLYIKCGVGARILCFDKSIQMSIFHGPIPLTINTDTNNNNSFSLNDFFMDKVMCFHVISAVIKF